MPDQVPVAINMECLNSITELENTSHISYTKKPWQEQTEKTPTSHKSAHVG